MRVRAGSSARENTGLSSVVVMGRCREGRKAHRCTPPNKTREAPQYADRWGRPPSA